MVPGDYITGQKATYFEHDFSFTVKREDFFQCRIYATCSKVCSIIFFSIYALIIINYIYKYKIQ